MDPYYNNYYYCLSPPISGDHHTWQHDINNCSHYYYYYYHPFQPISILPPGKPPHEYYHSHYCIYRNQDLFSFLPPPVASN